MSVNVKDIPIKDSNSISVEELLVEKYKSLNFKMFLLNSAGRWVGIGFLFLGILLTVIYKDLFYPKALLSVLMGIVAAVAYGSIHLFSVSKAITLGEKISNLEREIVKLELEKRFQYDDYLKDKAEDFYIKLIALTRDKELVSAKVNIAEVVIYATVYAIITFLITLRIP